MFRTASYYVAGFVFAVTLLLQPSPTMALDGAADLQWSVRRLNTWLGAGQKANDWRQYLLLNILETQAAKGPQGDYWLLQQIHDRFNSGEAGLDKPAFVDVRIAIEHQMKKLAGVYQGDLSDAFMAHVNQYRPISADQIDAHRDRASYDLQVLKRYYRRTMPSRDRANLFYDLQLDEAVDFLSGVEFELAPEVSVGKITSMINDKKRLLRGVTREIDALPADADDVDIEGPQPDDADADDNNEAQALAGPEPDDSTPLQILEQRRDVLQAAVKELTAKRKAVLKVDKPRLIRRRDNLKQMKFFSDRFSDVAKRQFDPYFVSAAKSYESFIQIYASGTADNVQEDMLKRLQALDNELSGLGDPDQRRATGRVGNLLEWFDNAHQVPSLVTAIRQRYSLPNLYLNISSGLINAVGGQTQTDTRVLDENVNGRLIRGHATTTSNVELDLIDDPNQVHISIHLQGQLASATRFRAGKFYGFVDANGQFEGRRSLYANVGGLFAGLTDIAANVGTTFNGLTTRSQLIQRIAFKQFNKGKAANDADAAFRAENEAFEQFDSLTDDAVADGQNALSDAYARTIDYAAWVPDLYLRTRPDFIEAVGKKDSIATLAAPNYPDAGSVPTDVLLRLHDSMLSNYVDPIFAGKTFTNEELATQAAEFTGEVPQGLATDNGDDAAAEDESFSITFDSVRPIQFEFDQNAITVSVSGKKFSQGEREINAGLQIRVRFKIKRVGGQLKFVRDGDAEIEYTDPDRKNAAIVAFKSFLEDKLNSEEASSDDNSIDLPENLLPVDKIKALQDSPIAKALQLVQFRIEKGWLYLGWRYQPGSQGSHYVTPVELPAIWNELVIDQYQSDVLLAPPSNAVEKVEPPQPTLDGAVQGQLIQ